MSSGAVPSRELSEHERALCAQVVRQWTSQGTLRFVRKSQWGSILLAVLIAAGAAWKGWSNSQAVEPFLPSPTVAIAWPYDPPARIELKDADEKGIKLEVEREAFDAQKQSIKLTAKITKPEQLGTTAEAGTTTLTLPVGGSYCTQVRTVYVISDLLKQVANEVDSSVVSAESRAAAQKALQLLGTLVGKSGYIEPGGLTQKEVDGLMEKRLIEPREQMLSPIAFQLTAAVPLGFQPKSDQISPWVFVVIAIGAILYAGFAFSASQGEHLIELTPSHFREYKDGRMQASVAWENATAQQSNGTLTITDKSAVKSYAYQASNFQGYSELRAAIIARIGLTEITHTVQYETY